MYLLNNQRKNCVSYNSLLCEHSNQMLIICFNIYKYCILKEIPIYVEQFVKPNIEYSPKQMSKIIWMIVCQSNFHITAGEM